MVFEASWKLTGGIGETLEGDWEPTGYFHASRSPILYWRVTGNRMEQVTHTGERLETAGERLRIRQTFDTSRCTGSQPSIQA